MFLSEYPSPSRFCKYSLGTFLSLLLLSACSPDNDALPGDDDGNTPPAALRIEVSASDFTHAGGDINTRATDNGATTTFENGDRIGIIVLDNNGTVLSDNIPYKYNGITWSFDYNNGEGKKAVYYDNKAVNYIAYFPYSVEANGIAGADILAALKAKFPPRYDQRTKDAYRASDLLTWSGTPSGSTSSKTLDIAFTHAYASLSLSPSIKCKINGAETSYIPSSVADVSFTIGTEPLLPYRADDSSHRIIVSPQTAAARWFCSYKAKTYGGTMSETALAANNRYTLAPALNIGVYAFANAQVGDFYCKNNSMEGYLIPGDVASLTDEQQAACIGIVYSTDINRIGEAAKQALKKKGVNTAHGLVMALTNASKGWWGMDGRDENSGGGVGEPFKANTDKLNKMYANVDGYGETHWIIDTYRNNGSDLQNIYTAFYHASLYGTAESSTEKYAAPTNTTGWFIPSMGQWWDILSNLGEINLDKYKNDTGDYTYINDAANTAVANMNKYLEKINGATQFRTRTWFLSSSECDGKHLCGVSFSSWDEVYLGSESKEQSGSQGGVRCSLAF